MGTRFCSSREAKGSSMRSTSGSVAKARAMLTRCFMPPERWWGQKSAKGVSPTRAVKRATASSRSAADPRRRRRP